MPERTMLGLSRVPLERDSMGAELVVDLAQGLGRDLVAGVDVVVAVHEDLRLDDGHQTSLLAQRGEPGQRMGVCLDAAPGRNAATYGDDGPPLGELRSKIGVLAKPVAQAVETLGDELAVSVTASRFGALVHLDAGNDPLARKHVDERDYRPRRPVGASRRTG